MDVSRPLRWVALGAGAVVALAIAAAVVAYATIDTQRIARYAADEVSRLTGRTVAARGPVTIAFWPRLAVVAHDVTISNPAGASRPELAHVRVVRGAVATWPLLRSRQVVAESIELEGLDVVLESLPDGRGNWELAAGPDATPGTPPVAPSSSGDGGEAFRLGGKFVLSDANVAWRPAGGTVLDVAIPRLEIAPQDGGRYAWHGTFEADGTRWSLDATTGDPLMTMRERVPLDVDAKLAGGGVIATATGRLERRDSGAAAVLDASLAWEAGSESMARWAPDLARESGRVGTRIDARDRRVVLHAIAGALGTAKFDGHATVDRSGKLPTLSARLHVDRIDLARERPSAGSATLAKSKAPPAPDASPLALLARFDGDVDFVVDRIRFPREVEATNARGRVVVAGGKLAADPIAVDLAGGRVTLRASADAATSRARVAAEGQGIELARLLGSVDPGRNASGGTTTFAVDLQGPVSVLARFVTTASGTIRVDVGPLRVKGAALDAGGEVFARVLDSLNPFRRVDPSTDIQCVVARLSVLNGVAHSDRTLAAETSRLALSASGTIDLRDETLDLLVRPRARKAAGLPAVELAEVVRVAGPIRHPSVRLDTMGAAKTALTIGGAIASGGWSLLATPLLNGSDDPNPCATARAGGKPSGNAASSSRSETPAADPLEALRGLFRR
ncbi:MAG: AsmA family protein [Betaproteobacteria bacterium]